MNIRLLRQCVAVLVFALAFVVNPFYVTACVSSADEDSQRAARAEAQLQAWLDELNGQGAFAFGDRDGPDNGSPFGVSATQYELLLELSPAKELTEQEGAMNAAYPCGEITFFQSASACDATYRLAVEGTITLLRLGDDPGTFAADVAVSGRLHMSGGLTLSLRDQDGGLVLERREGGAFHFVSFAADDLGGESFLVPGSF